MFIVDMHNKMYMHEQNCSISRQGTPQEIVGMS